MRDALKLSDADIWKNLAVMVGIPYLKRKLDEAYEVDAPRAMLGGTAYTRPPAKGAKLKERFLWYYRWFLRNIYPSLNAAYYFAMLAFNLGYLFDNTKYHNPFLWLIGTRIRRMNGADYQAIEALEKAAAKAGGAPRSGGSLLSPRNMGQRLMGGLSLVLPTSIFALKFLEWWYASDFAKQLSRKAAESLDLPPPTVTGLVEAQARNKPKPKITRTSEDGVEEKVDEKDDDEETEESSKKEPTPETAPIAASTLLPIFTVPPPKSSDLCPICEDEIQTPAACQTGVVYCFSCIHKWMSGTHARQEKFMTKEREGKWESGEGRCAVTGRKVLGGTEGLRRIMV